MLIESVDSLPADIAEVVRRTKELGRSGSVLQITSAMESEVLEASLYGGCPVSILYSKTPRLYTSVAVVMDLPSTCSGEAYSGVISRISVPVTAMD